MSKKKETPEKIEKETAPTYDVHLKVLADLFTPDAVYHQGDELEVEAGEAMRLLREHAGYFEVVPDEQNATT